MRPHTFCVSCGKVRTLDGPTARSLGFYLSGLSALKEHLKRSTHRFKMTQTQSRLISKDLEQLTEFEDAYGLALGAQIHLYLEAVRRIRPDLEQELVLRLLPKLKSASRKPFIDLMAQTPADAVQPQY
jgi:hypothetical protein